MTAWEAQLRLPESCAVGRRGGGGGGGSWSVSRPVSIAHRVPPLSLWHTPQPVAPVAGDPCEGEAPPTPQPRLDPARALRWWLWLLL